MAEMRLDDAAYISDEYGSALRYHSVRSGDVLMAGLGDETWPLGRCAVAGPEIGPAIVKADCYRLRLDDAVDAEFVAWYLSSPWLRQQFRLLSRGSTRARLNTALATDVPFPVVNRPAQSQYIGVLEERRADVRAGEALVVNSIDLLTEYKQSLITAAVTGEFDVTTASGRSV
jgi:type I restriction enzyme S subunit